MRFFLIQRVHGTLILLFTAFSLYILFTPKIIKNYAIHFYDYKK